MSYVLAILLAAGVLLATTLLHYEAIRLLNHYAHHSRRRHRVVLATVSVALVCVHLVEIGIFAGVFALAAGPMGLGPILSTAPMGPEDYYHYAAEAYASLGSADRTATGDTRLIASISPLNGILLLAWSGSFLFSLFDQGVKPVET
jgi:hypothetical protein